MAVERSGIIMCPDDGLITGVWLDTPRTDPIDRHVFDMSGWVASRAPVARLELVHGNSSQVGFGKAIGTVGVAPTFTVAASIGVDPLENQYGID
jgi:hypothetical protein